MDDGAAHDLAAFVEEALAGLARDHQAARAELIAILLTGPGQAPGLPDELARAAVAEVERRGTPEAASVLRAVAVLAGEPARSAAAAAVVRLPPSPVGDRIGGLRVVGAWRMAGDGLLAALRRGDEGRLVVLTLDEDALVGGEREVGADALDEEAAEAVGQLEAALGPAEPLPVGAFGLALRELVARTATAGRPMVESVALWLPALRAAAGVGPADLAALPVVAEEDAPPPPGRRARRPDAARRAARRQARQARKRNRR